MNIKQISYLHALHQTGSFTLAAKHCGVSQSTLSGGIAALESSLNAVLVERDKHLIRFTELGLGVIERSASMLEAARELNDYVSHKNAPMQGNISIGAIPSIAPFLLANLIKGLKAKYPLMKIQIREAQTAALLNLIREGSVDFGLIALPYDTLGLNITPLFTESLTFIASSQDNLNATPPTLATLDAERLVLLQEGHCLREHTLQSCSAKERSAAAIEASSLPTLVELVSAGLGVALLPAMAVNSDLLKPYLDTARIRAQAFAKPSPTRTIALASRLTLGKSTESSAIASMVATLSTALN